MGLEIFCGLENYIIKYFEQFFKDLDVQTFPLNEYNFQCENPQFGFKRHMRVLKSHINNYSLPQT